MSMQSARYAVGCVLLLLVVTFGIASDAGAGPKEIETLAVAVAGQSEELVLSALRSGADVNAQNQDGYLPLHLAARGGSLRITRLLFAHGAEVNARDGGGATALHWAVHHEQEAVAELLLDRGADSNAKNQHARTPLSSRF